MTVDFGVEVVCAVGCGDCLREGNLEIYSSMELHIEKIPGRASVRTQRIHLDPVGMVKVV